MSSIDLLILGLLMDKPMSAYEMNKEIEFRRMKEWAKVSAPAVYKNIIKLNEKGFCSGEGVKTGEMPEKTVYTITEKGKKLFFELMDKYSQDTGKFYSDFNIAVSNLPKMDFHKAVSTLENLRGSLYLKQNEMDVEIGRKQGIPKLGKLILKQYYLVNQTMIRWVEEFIEEYKKGNILS